MAGHHFRLQFLSSPVDIPAEALAVREVDPFPERGTDAVLGLRPAEATDVLDRVFQGPL